MAIVPGNYTGTVTAQDKRHCGMESSAGSQEKKVRKTGTK